MQELITARGLTKQYKQVRALDDVNLTVERGRIVGLIGPNGAGKTTFLKSVMGLIHHEGSIQVLGLDPRQQRPRVMQSLCYIADVASLPGWMRVSQAVEYTQMIHPRFRREKAEEYLARTDILPKSKIAKLSKGMKTQLHLALVMAIDADLLVLDEPTLGLDILYRRQFYTDLLNEYYDETRTILVSTHQVEEVEHILTDLVFINAGRIVLDCAMDQVAENFVLLNCSDGNEAQARALGPMYEEQQMGVTSFIFENVPRERLAELGKVRTPGVADLFVAKIGKKNHD